MKSIPIPAGFDPNKYFGDDDGVDDKKDKAKHQVEMGKTNVKKLSWEEKEQMLYQIYDEGKFPADLLEEGIECSSDEPVGNKP